MADEVPLVSLMITTTKLALISNINCTSDLGCRNLNLGAQLKGTVKFKVSYWSQTMF